MKSELTVSRTGFSFSLGNLVVQLGRLGILGASIWMLAAYCRQCESARNDFGAIGIFVLPVLGLLYGAFINMTGFYKDRPGTPEKTRHAMTEWYYGAIALTSLGGVMIIGAKYFTGTQACNQCFVFWVCQLALLCELLRSKTRIGNMIGLAIVTSIGLLVIVSQSSDARSFVIRQLSLLGVSRRVPTMGLSVGSKAPTIPSLSATSYKLILWTDCPVCLRSSIPGIVQSLGTDTEIYVAALSVDSTEEIVAKIPRAKVVVIDPTELAEWNVGMTAPPRAFVVVDGTISANIGGEKK